MNQADLEAFFSQNNVHRHFRDRIIQEFDGVLSNWALGAFVRMDVFLRGKYYDSKQLRLQELKDYIADQGLDKLIANILVAVLRANKDQSLQQVVGYLAPHMPHEDEWQRIRTAAELIAIGTSGKANALYCITRDEEQKPQVKVNHWDFVRDFAGELYEYIDTLMFNPPLVEQPLVVDNNRNCGYHTFQEPLLLGSHTQHDLPLDYACINTLNGIRWVLDDDVLNEPEIPPSKQDTLGKVMDHTRLKNQSQQLYQLLQGAPFHMAWQYDSRGRIYSHGYHINLQSYEYKKALLSFEKEEFLT